MSTLLLKHIRAVVTCDGGDRVLEDTDIFCRDGFIRAMGPDLAREADEVIDCTAMLCNPTISTSASPGTCPRSRTWSSSTGSGRCMRSGKI